MMWLAGATASATDLDINPGAPERYTVLPGDTLWDISARFLNSPWQWPEVWRENRQIVNPNLIYPGDVLVFRTENGAPRLTVEVPSELRLSPTVRSSPLQAAIPVIPIKTVGPFLTRPQVVALEEMERAPYVVDFAREHIVGAYDDHIYVRSIFEPHQRAFTILRGGKVYTDFETNEPIGQEGIFIADSVLQQTGDPATLLVTRAEKEVRIGDRVLVYRPETVMTSFYPHAPRFRSRGHILTVLDGGTQIGQYSAVSIDRGRADGIEPGHVLEVVQKGKFIRDSVDPIFGNNVIGPEQRAGLLMVFRTFERISYGLIMNSERFIHIGDIVQTP